MVTPLLVTSPVVRKQALATRGSFTSYVDKTRYVGHTGNVNGMQIFLITVKKLIHNLGIGKCSILDQILAITDHQPTPD